VVSILLSEPAPKQRLNLQRSREKILSAKKGMQSPTEKRDEEKEPKVYYVTSRTGLIEKKPPVRPHNRDLDLYEIRHAVFQKMRLDYLAEQNLSPEEREKYQVLLEDYNSRCEFYKYKSEDREKVHWDGKINAPRIIQDAQDILASWRPENKQEEIARLVENELLSLNNPIHVQHIVGRLQLYGYYHGQVLPESWNDEASRALLDFKVSNLGVVDSKWDRKTQNALFGK
jgi:MoaA/NifB/PqqE/SkfB family radical SAM enzyme